MTGKFLLQSKINSPFKLTKNAQAAYPVSKGTVQIRSTEATVTQAQPSMPQHKPFIQCKHHMRFPQHLTNSQLENDEQPLPQNLPPN
jgi:hypothetical protein